MLASKLVAARGLVLLGCGWIARRHAAAARRLGVPVLAASRDLARARAFARAHGAVAAFGSYAEAVSDPRARAAVVCTPHDRHLADARLALDAGLHVLVEKPIARTLEEADGMLAAARGAGRVLMVAENFRFMPAFRHVAALLDAGRLGALREVHLVARGFRAQAGWRLAPEAMGGGALIDSPGMQEFALGHLDQDDLQDAFPEFRPLIGQCRFYNCRHLKEPNCAILAVAFLNIDYGYSLLESLVYTVGVSGGYGVAIVLFASLRERVDKAPVPEAFKGYPIAFILAGLLSLAFMGFAGMFGIQL